MDRTALMSELNEIFDFCQYLLGLHFYILDPFSQLDGSDIDG